MITKQLVTKLAEERIAERDEKLFIVDLSISTSNIIRLEIDKTEGNVTIEDCVSVSRNIEHNLDREEVDFELHVSSAGLDKPLRVHQQFLKNVGRGLDIKLKSKEKITGTLVEVTDKGVVLEREEKQQLDPNKKKKTLVTLRNEVPFSDINEAKIVITFK